MTLERIETTPANGLDSWTGVVQEVAALAEQIAGTEFVPKGLRDNVPAVTAAILHGRELGLGPMTALQQTHVIDGKPTISAEGQRGLALAAGHEIEFVESTGARCTVRGRRQGSDRWTAVTWTIDAARTIGIANKLVWKNYPRAMLAARASAELCRMLFPDVLHGMAATEELDDDGAEVAAKPATRPVRRSTRAVAAPAIPTPEEAPEPPREDVWETPPPPIPAAPELPPDTDPAPPEPVTPAQLKMLGVMWSRYGVNDADRRNYTAAIVRRDIGGTTKNLTRTEAHALINLLAETIRPLADPDDVMSENVNPDDALAALQHYLEDRDNGGH